MVLPASPILFDQALLIPNGFDSLGSVQVIQFWQSEQVSLDLHAQDLTLNWSWKKFSPLVKELSFELKASSYIARFTDQSAIELVELVRDIPSAN